MNNFLAASLLLLRNNRPVINIQKGGATKMQIINAKAPADTCTSTIINVFELIYPIAKILPQIPKLITK